MNCVITLSHACWVCPPALMYVHLIPDSDTDWRLLPVILAPAMAGIVVWEVLVWRGVIVGKLGTAVLLGLLLNVVWQLTCLADWERFEFFVRHGRWPSAFSRILCYAVFKYRLR